jgi:hypothetical protein
MNYLAAFLEKLLGPNSKIRTLGLFILGSVIVLRFPGLIHGLPDALQKLICDAGTDIVTFGVPLIVFFVKQSNVTGNGTPDAPYQKPNPDDITTNKVFTPKLPILIACLACTIGLTSCGWKDDISFAPLPAAGNSAQPSRSAAFAKTATRILGNIAVGQLQALVSAELNDTDYKHAAAAAAWSAVDASDIAELINDATGHKAPALAAAASNIAYDSLQNGVSKDKTFDAIASAISAAAFAKK